MSDFLSCLNQTCGTSGSKLPEGLHLTSHSLAISGRSSSHANKCLRQKPVQSLKSSLNLFLSGHKVMPNQQLQATETGSEIGTVPLKVQSNPSRLLFCWKNLTMPVIPTIIWPWYVGETVFKKQTHRQVKRYKSIRRNRRALLFFRPR